MAAMLMHSHVTIFATVSNAPNITSMKSGTFNGMNLEKLHLSGNHFTGDISSKAFMDMWVKDLT